MGGADSLRKPGTAGQGRSAPSLRLRLLALVALLVLALIALGALAVWQAHGEGRRQAEGRLLSAARTLSHRIDLEFVRAEALLTGLAAQPGLAEGDAEAFLAAAARLGPLPDGRVLGLARLDQGQIANTARGRLPAPTPMPPALAAALAAEGTAISNQYPGTVTGRPTVAVAIRLRPAPGAPPGEPPVALGLSLPGEAIGAALAGMPLPPGAVAGLMDREGVILARSAGSAAVVGQRAVPALLQAMAATPEGVARGLSNRDGEASVVAFARAPISGYGAAVAMREAQFEAELHAALLRLALSALPVAVMGIALALLLGLRLRRALGALSGTPDGTRLAEVEELARALAEADAARATADAARSASEAALRERTAWLEQAQRAAAVGTWMWDFTTAELRWSEAMFRLYGLDPARHGPATLALWRSHVLPEDRAAGIAALERARATGRHEAEVRIRRADGAIRWIRASGAVDYAPDGTPLRLVGASHDITEQRLLAQEREARIAEKDLLVQEMHHRVKNSLQLVQGLLLMQARDAADPALAEKLREAAGRIVSIAAVHRRLYEGAPGEAQEVAEHLGGLVDDLTRSLGSSDRRIDLEVDSGMRLPADRMAALGLLVTELVTNALKHGAGRITIRFTPGAEGAVLEVTDEGTGFAADFDPTAVRGLGMRVALAMARQLRGVMEVLPGPHGRVVVRLPPTTEDAADAVPKSD
ncbi:PAS domain-containing protein [Roseomonas stagni]|uniref:histidine kinase n=1 Tax=Falsiroseomonas algicola TaxID=2716930 RepID=A0A6M1LJU3_9PROT|nr:sensor histidine kinase [Falsiroseomonas algicola]NGM20615.1 PAS domain-containing protein [Falsiroseomonas algicola]